MLMRCYEGTRNVRMLMTGRGEQAHVGVALLSGFGGANTAKEGEKTTIEESDAEKRARIWTEMQKMTEKQLYIFPPLFPCRCELNPPG